MLIIFSCLRLVTFHQKPEAIGLAPHEPTSWRYALLCDQAQRFVAVLSTKCAYRTGRCSKNNNVSRFSSDLGIERKPFVDDDAKINLLNSSVQIIAGKKKN